ncbi:hypothetical protein ACF1BQ_023010 [Bradyrhizobium sp. RDT10]
MQAAGDAVGAVGDLAVIAPARAADDAEEGDEVSVIALFFLDRGLLYDRHGRA